MVISGINHGANLGDDIYFSGTVGGARLAYIYGITGIAISLHCEGESEFFRDTSEFLLDYLKEQNFFSTDKYRFLNINYPDLPADQIKGVKYSSLGRRRYNDTYKIKSNTQNELNMRFTPGVISSQKENTDVIEVQNGCISITPLSLDCTDYDYLSYYSDISRHEK